MSRKMRSNLIAAPSFRAQYTATTELHEVTIETEGRINTTAIDYGKGNRIA